MSNVIIKLQGDEILSITVPAYWERSVIGFGSFSHEISQTVFNKHNKNNTSTVVNKQYGVHFKQFGEKMYIFVTK